MIVTKLVSTLILGYLLGSIPFGVLISRLRTGVDVRKYGSGKMGATNVIRTAGLKAGVLVAILDISKGALAVFLARLIVGDSHLTIGNISLSPLIPQIAAGIASIVGHVWPVFVKFRGGRGVGTFFGALSALCPLAAIFGGEVFIIGAGLTRFASLGSIAGVVSTYTILIPLTIINGFNVELLIYTFIGTVLIIALHRDNIVRLISGKERRLGDKVLTSSSKDDPLV